MTVTYQVGGGGHLDIDFWVRERAYTRALRLTSLATVDGPIRRSTGEAGQAVNWDSILHRKEGRQTRVLLLQHDELHRRQDRQVRVPCYTSPFHH